MSLSNMQVYDEQIRSMTIELLGQQTQKFNEASGNTLILDTSTWMGNYTRESFYQQIASAQRRVDRYAANGAAATTDLSESELVGVKVAGGFGPVLFEPSQLQWLESDPDEAIMVISEGFADALLADQLNTSVLSAVAAVENQAALVEDRSGTENVTQRGLNAAYAKFGDSSSMIRSSVMSGAAYHALVDEALANSNRLFQSSNVMVVDIQGKLYVVSDIPALYEAGTPNKHKVLNVVTNGVIVDNATQIQTNLETTNGKERIETTWQADYHFGLKMKGYAWDTANGGASPDDTELGTGSNWDKAVADDKHTLGTLLIASADL